MPPVYVRAEAVKSEIRDASQLKYKLEAKEKGNYRVKFHSPGCMLYVVVLVTYNVIIPSTRE